VLLDLGFEAAQIAAPSELAVTTDESGRWIINAWVVPGHRGSVINVWHQQSECAHGHHGQSAAFRASSAARNSTSMITPCGVISIHPAAIPAVRRVSSCCW